MNNFIKLGIISFIFLASFLMISLSSAQSADPTGNAPMLVASQEATIPLATQSDLRTGEAECPYKLRLRAGALFLHREDNSSRILAADNVGGHELVNASDLDLGFDTGTDISLMAQIQNFGAELRYFGLQDWSESEGPVTSPTAHVVISHPREMISIWGTGSANVSAKYNSWINNAECNLYWQPVQRYKLLLGVRWIKLSERLGFVVDTVGPDSRLNNNVSARNQLFGGQLGAEGILFGNPDQGFSLDGFVKAGCFNDNIHTKEMATINSSPIPSASGSDSKDKITFVGELGLNVNYAFTRNIALTARYQLLWLDRVALAPEQGPAAGVTNTDSVLYQGGCVGLTISF